MISAILAKPCIFCSQTIFLREVRPGKYLYYDDPGCTIWHRYTCIKKVGPKRLTTAMIDEQRAQLAPIHKIAGITFYIYTV